MHRCDHRIVQSKDGGGARYLMVADLTAADTITLAANPCELGKNGFAGAWRVCSKRGGSQGNAFIDERLWLEGQQTFGRTCIERTTASHIRVHPQVPRRLGLGDA